MTATRFAPLTNAPIRQPLMDRLAERRVHDRFMALPRHLPRGAQSLERPNVWYCRQRDEARTAPMGKDLLDALCDVARSAAKTGNSTIIAETKRDMGRLFDDMLAVIDRAFGTPSPESLDQALVDAEKETARVMERLAVAGTTRTESELRAAAEEIPGEIAALETVRETIERKLAST